MRAKRASKPRGERGVAFPSPVAILSVVAVAMAGIAYVATQGQEPTEREVTTVSRADDPATHAPAPKKPKKQQQRLPKGKRDKIRKAEPKVARAETYVEVYNNSGITGLAAQYAGKASEVGWQVVGEDNWYGTIPASTVYYPERLKAAGKQLALDLGIDRSMPATGTMRMDRLTVVLTADAA